MTVSSKLSSLQRLILDGFFRRSHDYFLTGGGALAGFHFGHRTTDDLDFFATPGVDLDAGARTLRALAAELGAAVEAIQESPDFRRYAVRVNDETTLVDLVVDRAPQLVIEKDSIEGIRVDPIREIAANKICALLGRSAPRDLVDVRALLAHGLTLEHMLADARTKDGAVDPATLAWVLGSTRITGGMAVPAGVDVDELDAFRESLVDRLTRLALPGE